MTSEDQKDSGRQQYELLWKVTDKVIRHCDPYSLLAGGAPADEYDREVCLLVAETSRINSITDAEHAISRVFASSFNDPLITPDSCKTVGHSLFAAFQERGLK